MASEPRHHHFVPSSFLAAFTEGGGRDSRLYVFDKRRHRLWPSTPLDAGKQRDFYRVEAGGADPNIIEKSFVELEGNAAAVILEMNRSKQLPPAGKMEWLLAFIALQATRTCRPRRIFNEFSEDMMKTEMRLRLHSDEEFKKLVSELPSPPPKLGHSDARAFLESGDFNIIIDQTYNIGAQLKMAETALNWLLRRNWMLLVAPANSHFICSDEPVSLMWMDSKREGRRSPGFALPGTEVVMPLSKSLAITGVFEDLPSVATLNEEQVANVNTVTSTRAERFLYMPSSDFLWFDERDNSLKRLAGFRELISEAAY